MMVLMALIVGLKGYFPAVWAYDCMCRFGAAAVPVVQAVLAEHFPQCEYVLALAFLIVPYMHLQSHSVACQDKFSGYQLDAHGLLGTVAWRVNDQARMAKAVIGSLSG